MARDTRSSILPAVLKAFFKKQVKAKRQKHRRQMFEILESRSLLTVLSGDGGQGGTSQSAPLDPDLNLIRFQWENFSIPDEFQILFQGKRIAGDVGLQSGGHSGTKV